MENFTSAEHCGSQWILNHYTEPVKDEAIEEIESMIPEGFMLNWQGAL